MLFHQLVEYTNIARRCEYTYFIYACHTNLENPLTPTRSYELIRNAYLNVQRKKNIVINISK